MMSQRLKKRKQQLVVSDASEVKGHRAYIQKIYHLDLAAENVSVEH